VYSVCGAQQLVRRGIDALFGRTGSEQRFVAVSMETATAPGECCGKTQARDDRRLFDHHRRQAIGTVDQEVGRNRERQAEHADDVFDDPVSGRRQQYMATFPQRGCILGRQQTLLFEPVDALSDV
jgi:hypothetical protein